MNPAEAKTLSDGIAAEYAALRSLLAEAGDEAVWAPLGYHGPHDWLEATLGDVRLPLLEVAHPFTTAGAPARVSRPGRREQVRYR